MVGNMLIYHIYIHKITIYLQLFLTTAKPFKNQWYSLATFMNAVPLLYVIDLCLQNIVPLRSWCLLIVMNNFRHYNSPWWDKYCNPEVVHYVYNAYTCSYQVYITVQKKIKGKRELNKSWKVKMCHYILNKYFSI